MVRELSLYRTYKDLKYAVLHHPFWSHHNRPFNSCSNIARLRTNRGPVPAPPVDLATLLLGSFGNFFCNQPNEELGEQLVRTLPFVVKNLFKYDLIYKSSKITVIHIRKGSVGGEDPRHFRKFWNFGSSKLKFPLRFFPHYCPTGD